MKVLVLVFLTVWSLYSKNIFLSLVLALAFPLIVLIFNFRSLINNRPYRFALELLLVGTLEFMLLLEKGNRLGHVNFSWGYMSGLFIVFMMSIWLLFNNTILKKNNRIVLIIEWICLSLHFIAGIIYFIYLLNGGDFSQF